MDLHASAGPAESGLGLEDSVRAEQLKLLLTNRVDLYAAVLWAAVVIAVERNVYPNWLLALWFFVVCGLVLTRSLITHRFRAVNVHSRQSLRRWSIFATSAAIVHGSLWGLTASAILLSPDLGIRVFTMIMLGGMMAGGMMASAASAVPMLGFALPTIIPAILAMGSRPGGMFLGFAVMQAFYGLIVLNAALKMNRSITDAIRLRFAQADLLAKLQVSESAMAEAQQLAKVGSWDVNLQNGTGRFSAEAYDIFGVDPASFQPTFETALTRVHPEDKPALQRYLSEFKGQLVSRGIDLRLVMDDGAIKYVRESRRKILNAGGKVIRIIGSVQDVTERRLAKETLQFANLVLKTQMEASPEGILVVDANRHLIDCNQRFAEIWGIAPADLVTPDDVALRAHMAALVKAPAEYAARGTFLAGHPNEIGDDEIEMADGRILARYSRALQSASGQQLGRVWFYNDITERRAAERKLQFANLLLNTQMDASPDGILVVDTSRRIIAFNRRFTEIWHVPLAALHAGDDTPILERVMSQIKDADSFAARVSYLFDNPGVTGDDEIETIDGRIFERHSVPLTTGDGEYLGRAWFFSEVTERRTAERKLQYTNILLTTQMESSPDGIMVVDEHRMATSFNKQFSEVWRLPQDILAPGNDDEIRAGMRSQVKNLEGYTTRVRYLADNPAEIGDDEIETLDGRFIERHSQALRSAAGDYLGSIMFFSDITKRRAAEKDLLLANVLLKTQMEASPDGILVINPNQQIIAFNRRLADIWRISLAELKNNDHRKGIERISANLKDPAGFVSRSQYLLDHPDEIGDDEIETLDGRIIERHSVPLNTEAGGYLGRAWFFSDITERKRAAATLAYRDHLLHAVTAATSVAVRAVSLEEGVPEALRKIGESMGVHRIVVIQDTPCEIPPLALRFKWEDADIAVPFELIATGEHQFDPVEMAAWSGPLQDSTPVFADAASAKGAVLAMLNFYEMKSVMLAPVHVGGHVWGFIGIADCKVIRQWTGSEIETLGILADTAGALIVRERARVALETSEELFRLLAATAKDAVILTGPAGEILQWNPAAERIFGYTAAEALGKVAAQLIIRPQDRERVIRNIAAAVAELAMTLEFTFIRKDGSEVATEISVSAMPIGGRQGILSILRDITERKIARDKLQFANIMLATQMEASPDGIIAVNASGAIISYNRRYAEMWNVPLELLEAGDVLPVRAILAALMKDPAAFTAWVRTLLEHPGQISDDELETADGRFIERHSRTMHSTTGENFGRVWFMRDITARRNAEALALRLARYDVLTGLANRAVFVEAVNHAVAQAKRSGESFAILYLDLDHFKDVNDTLGHPVGDALLKEVADRLRANTRQTDTVGRFGGDEFAIVATEIKDPADAALLAEKLVAAIAAPYVIDNNSIHTQASIGVDLYSPKAADPETLLSHADTALYRAKSDGRGTYRFFTASMDRDVHARVKLSGELREALVSGQLFLLYQPQVMAATGKITGLEALIRWNHPTRGMLVPDNFIPVAESTGLISILGHFVFWTACRQAKAWITAGLAPIRISVNVSALQFKTAMVLEADIMAALNETGLPPNLLELELTETVLMAASREHTAVLARLRGLGIKLSIDDFGTGYSSLDYLRRLPVDHIKIAQSFIKNVETEAGDAAVVRAIIGIARVMRIKVIAEGVATRTQLELLQSWGCNEVQGFYFARPLPVSDITQLLRDGGVIQPKPKP